MAEGEGPKLQITGVLARADVPDAYGVAWTRKDIEAVVAGLRDGTMTIAAEWRVIEARVSPLGVAIVRADLTGIGIVKKERPT